MNTLGENIQVKYLAIIKKMIATDDSSLKVLNRRKNTSFLLKYNLKKKDIINIILGLTKEDIMTGPEFDKDTQYDGWIFKFCPMFKIQKIYIKIRVENENKAICISIHEFGLYEEED